MKKVLINYADKFYYNAQKNNSRTGRVFGFDEVIEYNFSVLDNSFKEKNKSILEYSRGAGLWIWKPYIILKTLRELNEGDLVFYADSGSYFIDHISKLLYLFEKEEIIIFGSPYKNKQFTKMDAFYFSQIHAYESQHAAASFIFVKKSTSTISFFEEYLKLCEDIRIVSDLPNECGLSNFPEFIEHRHDQSVLSLLCHKYQISMHRDLSQWGNTFPRENDNYPQIINHNRDR